jgi:hypothetical protein
MITRCPPAAGILPYRSIPGRESLGDTDLFRVRNWTLCP